MGKRVGNLMLFLLLYQRSHALLLETLEHIALLGVLASVLKDSWAAWSSHLCGTT